MIVASSAPAGAAVEVLRAPEGGIQPQVAADDRGRVHLIYFLGDPSNGDAFYARSDDGGKTFGDRLRVNSQPGAVMAIGHVRGARMALGKGSRIHVAWMGSQRTRPKIGRAGAPMLYTRMSRAGDRFEPERNVDVSHPGLDGGGDVAADAQGDVYVAWHSPEHAGEHEADRRVWIARSADDGETFAPEIAASPAGSGACGCCGLTVAAGPSRSVHILFRTASEMVHRDMTLLASTDGARTFKPVVSDPWTIGACVMSTSHIAREGNISIAGWETEGAIRVLRLTSNAGEASPFSIPGGKGDRKYPAVAVDKTGAFIVAWAEGTGWNKGGAAAWQVFDADGTPRANEAGRVDGLPAWDFPAVFAVGDGFKVIY